MRSMSQKRLAKFKPRLARSGLSNVHPVRIESEHDIKIKRFTRNSIGCRRCALLRFGNPAAAIPDLKWRQTPESVAEISSSKHRFLRPPRPDPPGGRLVYATCSLLEGMWRTGAIVAGFLEKNPDFVLLPASDVLSPAGIENRCGRFGVASSTPHRAWNGWVLRGRDGAAMSERNISFCWCMPFYVIRACRIFSGHYWRCPSFWRRPGGGSRRLRAPRVMRARPERSALREFGAGGFRRIAFRCWPWRSSPLCAKGFCLPVWRI